jgi:hypothetical protein
MANIPKDKFVLQHERWGTIHQLEKGNRTYCGNGNNGGNFKRKRLSKALAHPLARFCKTPKKCGAHEKD